MLEEDWKPADLLPQALEIARRAGAAIMEVYAELNPAIEYKKDDSPLTQADLASHGIVCDALAQISTRIPVLSEESTEIPYEARRDWDSFWLVDPLDGTKEFVNRNGEFTVNIALVRGRTPILGVVYAPATDVAYFAAEGAGAHKSEGEIAKPIHASQKQNPAPKIVVSRWHGDGVDAMRADLEKIGVDASCCEFVPMGSSLKFCMVAEGSADLYLRNGPTMEWDTAAAQCVLEMAGGAVSDLEGNPLTYNKPVLRNPSFLASATRMIPLPA
ncbi:MAG: 3'(2'),5'-bisphosphate nucleotidase CysQ [Terracidiphilus sp.]